ncbi:hypothetical protein D6T65_05045 [Arthrobacter frigidicola]|nr:hypothetical protein D6T65_05045 [Arthrobacter frigidicola]
MCMQEDRIVGALAQRLAPEAKNVRALVIDIESKPLLAYTWGLWDQNIGTDFIVDHGGMICFAAKWLGRPDSETMFFSEHKDGKQAMIEAAHHLLSEADYAITYNGDRYDFKRLNNEFLLAGMAPPKPYKSIDLMKTNKQRFDLPSRKLDYLVQRTGVGAKVKHEGFSLWLACIAGEAKAWKKMERYNRGDIRVTEKAYLRLLPWLTNAPHLGMFTSDEHSCPYCGSTKLVRDGHHSTNVTQYRLYSCKNCKGWVRGTQKLVDATRTRAAR